MTNNYRKKMTFNKIKNKFEPLYLVIFFYAIFVALNLIYGKTIMDSDASSEMILARLLNKEKALISNNWFYSTELRVLGINIFYRIGLLLFPNNWHLARVFGQSLLMAINVVSMIYMLNSIGFGKKSYYIAAILELPLGIWNIIYSYYEGFYLINTIFIYPIIGLFFKYIDTKKIKYLLLSTIVNFLFGLNGIKALLYISVPLFVVGLILYLNKIINDNDYDIRQDSKERVALKISFINLFSSLIGTGVYKYLCYLYEFDSNKAYKWVNFDFSKILTQFGGFLSNVGYPNNDYFDVNIDVMSIRGLLGCFSLVIIFLYIVSNIIIIKKYNKISINEKYIYCICFISVLFSVVAQSCMMPYTFAYYYLPLLFTIFIVIEISLELFNTKKTFIKNTIRLLIIISVCLSSLSCILWFNDCHPRKNDDLNSIVQYMSNNNIEKVYGTFWNSNIITELTNGEVETYTYIYDENGFNIRKWLQEKEHISNFPYKNVYIIVEKGLLDEDLIAKTDGFQIVVENGSLLLINADWIDSFIDFYNANIETDEDIVGI